MKNYEQHKANIRERESKASEDGRNIAPIPPVAYPDRRAAAELSLKVFCETYFADVFSLAWSPDHLRVLAKIEDAVNGGNLCAIAMPRGSGKTAMLIVATQWASFTGRTQFTCIIAANADQAKNRIEAIKSALETNELLLQDFPEVCYPIRRLERIINRQKGQHLDGEYTRMEFGGDKIILPTVAGSRASGVIITSSGLKGGDIRGQFHVTSDGEYRRPDLVFVDDPQTTESAYSPSQCQRRESLLAADVLGMSGPGKKIAGLMACTVIRQDDMADNILNRDKHPEWHGERTKMVYLFPANEKLWHQYAELRATELRNDGDGSQATEFYKQHKDEMDAGSQVAWTERFNEDELSAIQHAMNLRYRDEAAFFSEYQNEPMDDLQIVDMLTVDEIAGKLNRIKQAIVPLRCNHLTMFADMHENLVYWMVCAWEDNFTGYVIDYGTWPDQKRAYFTLSDARYTIAMTVPSAGLEGRLYHALEQLTTEKLNVTYRREDDAPMKIEQLCIDASWGMSTDVVYQFAKQSAHSRIIYPWHGKYYGATTQPMGEGKVHPGTRAGLHWQIRMQQARRQRYVLADVNFWKSFVHGRLSVAMGDVSCLSLYGSKEIAHRLIAEHLTAQYPVRAEAQGRTVDEWKVKPGKPDDHWLDCLVGCAVGASIRGVTLGTHVEQPKREKKKISFADMQRQAKKQQGS